VNISQYGYRVSGGFSYTYDPVAHVGRAAWTFSAAVGADKLLLDLADSVKDRAGNALDGEWTDATSGYPSGNGAGGGDFEFRLNVLPGDVNQSGRVGNIDTNKVIAAGGSAPGNPKYSTMLDVNGSGQIGNIDTNQVIARGGAALPTGEPANVLIVETGGSTSVAEGGATDTYALVLTSAPNANVTISLGPDSQVTAVDQANPANAFVTFTPGNWSVPQTVLVRAVDDSLVEGPHTGTISQAITTTDARYAGIHLHNVVAGITDNDAKGGLLPVMSVPSAQAVETLLADSSKRHQAESGGTSAPTAGAPAGYASPLYPARDAAIQETVPSFNDAAQSQVLGWRVLVMEKWITKGRLPGSLDENLVDLLAGADALNLLAS